MFIITTCQFNLDGPIDMIEQELAFATRCPSGVYLAPIIESIQSVNGNISHRVQVLIEILADRDRVCDALLREIPTSSISFDSLEWHQNCKGPVEGVVIVDDAVGSDLAEKLSSDIYALAAYQVQSNNVDYHPNSNEIVHDLVHPGLYSYVKGVTPVQALNECIPTDLQQDVKKDFWGRQYEDSVYQWLPTYFSVLQYKMESASYKTTSTTLHHENNQSIQTYMILLHVYLRDWYLILRRFFLTSVQFRHCCALQVVMLNGDMDILMQ